MKKFPVVFIAIGFFCCVFVRERIKSSLYLFLNLVFPDALAHAMCLVPSASFVPPSAHSSRAPIAPVKFLCSARLGPVVFPLEKAVAAGHDQTLGLESG